MVLRASCHTGGVHSAVSHVILSSPLEYNSDERRIIEMLLKGEVTLRDSTTLAVARKVDKEPKH